MIPIHQHGGQLRQAAQHYQIPLEQWLDLSTGISPHTYPLVKLPLDCWQRLPECNDGLEIAAVNYYGSEILLPVSGSQEAIQRLPLLRQKSKVGIVSPAYHSHAHAWQKLGHQVVEISPDAVEESLDSLDVLIVVNPSNPTACYYQSEQLKQWHQQLQSRKAWLIVDEAFMDSTPELSLIEEQPQEGLIVLRSIGKFFGLAGIRLGFVWANEAILQSLVDLQDDWSVSHPARYIGKLALANQAWQKQQREILKAEGERLAELLQISYQQTVTSTPLFSYINLPQAAKEHQRLAQKGILTRLFTQPSALRFGLPCSEQAWQRLERVLLEKTA